jgi:hypothetical protein
MTLIACNILMSQGFAAESLKEAMLPCAVCAKTVYPMEFVGISNKV